MENYLALTESLVEKLKDKTLTPRQRVDIYLDLQKYYMFFDYEEVLKYCNLAIKLAIKTNDKGGEYSSKTNKAIALYELKQFEQSLKIFFENKKHFEKTDNIDAVNFVLFNIGNIYCDIEEYTEAIKSYNISLKFYKSRKDYRKIVAAQLNIAYSYLKLLQYDLSLKISKSTLIILDIHDMESRDYFRACIHSNMATCYLAQKNIIHGLEYAQRAIDVFNKSNATQYLILAYENVLDAYIMQSDEEKLYDTYRRIYNLIKDNYSYHLPRLYKKLYEYYLKTNQYKKAILYFEKFYSESIQKIHEERKIQIIKDTEQVYGSLIRSKETSRSATNIFNANHSIVVECDEDTIQKINISHIVHIEYKSESTYIYMMNGDIHVSTYSFSKIETLINQNKSEDHLFFHLFERTSLINLFWLESFNYRKKKLILNAIGTNYELPISARQCSKLKKLLLNK